MTPEEFYAELEKMKKWLPKDDRNPEAWWAHVEDYAKAEFTKSYKLSYKED